jgi:hypothetical protein
MKLIITENQLRGIVGEMSDKNPPSLVLGFLFPIIFRIFTKNI